LLADFSTIFHRFKEDLLAVYSKSIFITSHSCEGRNLNIIAAHLSGFPPELTPFGYGAGMTRKCIFCKTKEDPTNSLAKQKHKEIFTASLYLVSKR
jgi:hypothetical protein